MASEVEAGGVQTPTSDVSQEQSFTAPATNASIEALQADQRMILDLVDKLRRKGLSSLVSLPQIAVVGDQSSGKSSVLEAITQIPFPRKENLCTRFATEIIMRREPTESISCRINPDTYRPPEEKKALRNFHRTMSDFSELPSLIDEATEKMNLSHDMAFSKDVLSIEICGPDRPQLLVFYF
jgi:Dynamin family